MRRPGGAGSGSPGERLISASFLLVTGAAFSYYLAIGLLVPALPRFVEGPLRGGPADVALTVGIFSLASLVARPTAGRLGDRRGRRLIMVAGVALVGGAVALYPLAGGIVPILALRVAQGAGHACFYVGAVSAITEMSPEDRRGEAVSYFSLAIYVGLALGPMLAESVLRHGHYGRVWLLVSSFSAVAALLGARTRETVPQLVAAAGRGPFLHRAALVPGAVLGLGMVGYAGFMAFVPLYATASLHLASSGPVFVLYAVVAIATRLAGARVPDRFGTPPTALIATSAIATGLVLIGAWPAPAGLYLGTAAFAAGVSLNYPALLSWAIHGTAEAERGSVVGTFTACFDLGQGVGSVVLGLVAVQAGYRGAFLVGGLIACASLAIIGSHTVRRSSPDPVSASAGP